MLAETMYVRSGEGVEVDVPLLPSERRRIEKYIAFRRAGLSHKLALRWSR